MKRAVKRCKFATPAEFPKATLCIVVTVPGVCLNPPVSEPAKSAWDSYRRWKRFAWVAVPLCILALIFSEWRGYVLPLWLMSLILIIRVQWFPCPQCGQLFFCKSSFFARYKPWVDACVHCGHPKWAYPLPKPPSSDPHPWPEPNVEPDPGEKRRSDLMMFLTLVLASDPTSIGLRLDPEGWTDLDHLITRAKRNGLEWTRDQILEAASCSKNPSVELDPAGKRIRFRQS